MTEHPSPVDDAGAAVRRVTESSVVERGARLGLAVSGVLHLLIGVLAVQLALGDPGAAADQSGALTTLSRQPAGLLVLAVVTAGIALLALWQIGEAIVHREPKDRAKAIAKAVTYLALAGASLGFLLGRPQATSTTTRNATATLLNWPGGPALVVVVGLIVVVVGGVHVHSGVTQRFLKDLAGHPGPAFVRLGQVGYVAKGLALAVAGLLFAQAGITHDPSGSTGLDGALQSLLRLPVGRLLVVLVGAGFAAFGLYSFARARHVRV